MIDLGPLKDSLQTPCLVIDTDKMDANIRRMAEIAAAHGVKLRPHAKTHKIPRIAKRQIAAGAAGITVAKVSEAEVMAAGGIRDIFIAFPLVSPQKIERAIHLADSADLILAVDSLDGAAAISAIAGRHGKEINVRLKIDTGMRRTGVAYDQAVRLAAQIRELSGVRLSGIYTYRGPILQGKPTRDLAAAGLEEGKLMVDLAEEMRGAGIPIDDVSVGSSPTGPYVAAVKGVTEIRPGTYVYQDRMQASLGLCSLDDCAGFIVATVVSLPTPVSAVIDGGSKTFATDAQPGAEPFNLQGFGYFRETPDALLVRMSEEHGVVSLPESHNWRIGDIVTVIPNHICSTVNLHNHVYLAQGGRLRKVPVAARGMLE